MIYCPRCGTANREGSRFCNECGQKLGTHTRIKCPHCGSMNSVQNVFCDECGGHLLPSPLDAQGAESGPPIKGLSLPTKASQSEEEALEEEQETEPTAEVPAWLRALGDTWSTSAGQQEAAAEEGKEVPDWLQDLQAPLPDQDEEETHSRQDEVSAGQDLADSEGEREEEEPRADMPEDAEVEEGEWGAEPEPTEEQEEVPVVEGEAQRVPSWLAALDLGPEEEEEPVLGSEEGSDERALDVVGQSDERDEEAEVSAPGPEEPEAPEWLAALQAAEGDEEEAVVAIDEPASEGEEEPELPTEEGDEFAPPEWLAALGLVGAEEVPPSDIEEEALASEGLGEMDESQPEEEEQEPSPAEGDQRPEWLLALGLVGAAAVVGSESEEEATEEGEHVQPEEPQPEIPAEDTGVEAPAEDLGIPEAELPEWLDALRPPEAGEVVPDDELAASGEAPDWLVPVEGEMDEEGLARADIPAWLLALKPMELREEEEDAGAEPLELEEPPEEGGLLAGIAGALPVEMLVAQPRAVTSPGAPELPPSDTPQARLFAEIVRRPPESVPKPMAQPSAPSISRVPLWIIYVALIAVAVVPLLLGEPLLLRPADPLPSVVDLYQSIESLESGAAVLVAFDYDPTNSGEMNVLAQTIVGHLMDRGVRVVVVSLLPEGPATAQMVLDEAAQGRPGNAESPGQMYANLGYLPGQVAAVRLLGQSLEQALPRDFRATPLAELEAAAGVTDLESFALIVELAASQETLRWWVEQAATPYEVPLAAGVGASVEPMARAYYQTESRQLAGLVAGVPGAAEYEALVSNQDVLAGPIAVRLDAQLAGHVVFVLVLLAGAVVQSTRRRAGRGQ